VDAEAQGQMRPGGFAADFGWFSTFILEPRLPSSKMARQAQYELLFRRV